MDEMTELEKMVTDEAPEKQPDNSPLQASKWAYNIAALVIDLVTGWTIWQLTFWYYGVFWFCAGAIAFYLHQKNWEREGNNESQRSMSMTGIIVSVASMLIMAIASASLLIARVSGFTIDVFWSEMGVIFFTVALFGFHSIWLARYYFEDDDWKINNDIARARAQANKKVKIAEAAGKVVEANAKALRKRDEQYKKHGDRGAVDAAINKMDKREKQQNQPQQRPMTANAQEVQQVRERDTGTDPTNPPRKNG